jgi:hypothetical protein
LLAADIDLVTAVHLTNRAQTAAAHLLRRREEVPLGDYDRYAEAAFAAAGEIDALLAAAPPPPRPAPVTDPARPTIDKEIEALAALAALGANVAAISRQTGIPRATLYGLPKFRAAFDRMREAGEKAKRARRRGRRASDRDFVEDE